MSCSKAQSGADAEPQVELAEQALGAHGMFSQARLETQTGAADLDTVEAAYDRLNQIALNVPDMSGCWVR